jgi:hypothetical protein
MKADPRGLIRAHYATLVNAQTDKVRLLDHLQLEGIPALAFAICWLSGVALSESVSVGLLTVAGLLSAFFFGAMLQLSQRAMDWADSSPTPGEETSYYGRFLRQTTANAGYASLISILAAAIFVIVAASAAHHHTAQVIFSAIGLGLSAHLMLLLAMVLRRLFALTDARLTDAETGHRPLAAVPDNDREAV